MVLVYINFLHTHILLNIVVPRDLIFQYSGNLLDSLSSTVNAS